jgi:hypothetical protein
MPVDDPGIVTLPLSGWQFQVRADGSWRDLGLGEWSEDDYKDTWDPATEFFDYNGRAEDLSQGGVGWWLLYGNVPSGTTVTVALADGQRPTAGDPRVRAAVALRVGIRTPGRRRDHR